MSSKKRLHIPLHEYETSLELLSTNAFEQDLANVRTMQEDDNEVLFSEHGRINESIASLDASQLLRTDELAEALERAARNQKVRGKPSSVGPQRSSADGSTESASLLFDEDTIGMEGSLSLSLSSEEKDPPPYLHTGIATPSTNVRMTTISDLRDRLLSTGDFEEEVKHANQMNRGGGRVASSQLSGMQSLKDLMNPMLAQEEDQQQVGESPQENSERMCKDVSDQSLASSEQVDCVPNLLAEDNEDHLDMSYSYSTSLSDDDMQRGLYRNRSTKSQFVRYPPPDTPPVSTAPIELDLQVIDSTNETSVHTPHTPRKARAKTQPFSARKAVPIRVYNGIEGRSPMPPPSSSSQRGSLTARSKPHRRRRSDTFMASPSFRISAHKRTALLQRQQYRTQRLLRNAARMVDSSQPSSYVPNVFSHLPAVPSPMKGKGHGSARKKHFEKPSSTIPDVVTQLLGELEDPSSRISARRGRFFHSPSQKHQENRNPVSVTIGGPKHLPDIHHSNLVHHHHHHHPQQQQLLVPSSSTSSTSASSNESQRALNVSGRAGSSPDILHSSSRISVSSNSNGSGKIHRTQSMMYAKTAPPNSVLASASSRYPARDPSPPANPVGRRSKQLELRNSGRRSRTASPTM